MALGDPSMWSIGQLGGGLHHGPLELPVYESGAAELLISPGALATEPPHVDFLLEETYRPGNLRELVRETPSEIVRRTILELDSKTKVQNGKVIEPLPLDMVWFQGASLRTDLIYTAIRQVVQTELERFAAELDKHFIFIPKENG